MYFTNVLFAVQALPLVSSCGITPENLAVAGFNDDETHIILKQVQDNQKLTVNINEYLITVDTVLQDYAIYNRKQVCKPEDETIKAKIYNLETRIANLNTRRIDIYADIWSVAIQGFDKNKIHTLENVIKADQCGIPLEYRTYEFASGEWDKLKMALTYQKQCIKLRIPLPYEYAKLISEINSSNNVIQAKLFISSYLEADRKVYELLLQN